MNAPTQTTSPLTSPAGFGFRDLAELTRLRLTTMILLTVAVGFVLATPDHMNGWRLVWVLVGLGLVSGGSTAFNQVLERDTDAKMTRTCDRPLPQRRITPVAASVLGAVGCGLGLVLLSLSAGALTAILAAASAAIYVLVYTPLKRRSSFNTLIGAISGALPPVIGWTGATGKLATGALVVFGILFVWQLVHLFAIAWTYREDYAQAGLVMVSGTDDRAGDLTMRLIVLSCLTMVPVSLAPVLVGLAGPMYVVAAAVLSLGFLAAGICLAMQRSRPAARGLFLASLAYLPLLLIALVIDHVR